MAIKFAIIFAALVLGCLVTALPTPGSDYAQFFGNSQSRIVGGTVARPGSHPYMVALSYGALVRNFVCGGALLSRRTILTAAHCVEVVVWRGSLLRTSRVSVGSNQWNGGTMYRLSSNATHPHYVWDTIKNDVGLLYTDTNIVFSELVRPIVLDFEYVGANIPVQVVGFGRTELQGPLASQLLELNTYTISGEQCIKHFASHDNNDVEPHIEICTDHPNGAGFGNCNGDSGGPLIRRDRGTLIGVVSWGIGCARGYPDVYARVSAFRPWFEQNVRA